MGIHHMIKFTLEERVTLKDNNDVLAHIHKYYTIRRKGHHFKDRLLIRN